MAGRVEDANEQVQYSLNDEGIDVVVDDRTPLLSPFNGFTSSSIQPRVSEVIKSYDI